MLVDTHAHLNFKSFNKDIDEVIKRAKEIGVEKIVVPGAKISSSRKAIKIARKYKPCYAAVGVHPHHVNETNESVRKSLTNELSKLISQSKVVAIGEIGLDYHQYKNDPSISLLNKKNQGKIFLTQLSIAKKTELPVIIHCREAYDDLIDICISLTKKTKKLFKGVFHCFEGEKKHLYMVLDLGFYIGFDGNITYPENNKLRDLVKLTPLDRLLLETDSPFLTPIQFRGHRNEPANLNYIAAEVAKVKNNNTIEVARITSSSAFKLFSFM